MRPEPPRERSLIERPARLAAVGAAAMVCLLSVGGALGVPFVGNQAVAAQGSHASRASERTAPQVGANAPASQLHQATPPDSQAPEGTQGQQGKATSDPPKEKTDSSSVALPRNSGEGKRIVFDMTAQRVWLVGTDGTVARTYPVSGSKYDNLNPGTYSVTSRSRYATAYNSNETLNYMERFAHGRTAAIGFHAIPVRPDGTRVEKRSGLGVPASDGCIRQWITDARALWRFAPVGTSVVVLA